MYRGCIFLTRLDLSVQCCARPSLTCCWCRHGGRGRSVIPKFHQDEVDEWVNSCEEELLNQHNPFLKNGFVCVCLFFKRLKAPRCCILIHLASNLLPTSKMVVVRQLPADQNGQFTAGALQQSDNLPPRRRPRCTFVLLKDWLARSRRKQPRRRRR